MYLNTLHVLYLELYRKVLQDTIIIMMFFTYFYVQENLKIGCSCVPTKFTLKTERILTTLLKYINEQQSPKIEIYE